MVKDFWKYLQGFRFSGEVWALREGEIFFPNEPILQVIAPLPEAQLLETYLLSIFNIECLVASKAVRIVQAAIADRQKRGVVDFGSRRAHGPEAAVLASRAAYIAGCLGTSNVYAGQQFELPTYGTLAHSWISAFDQEEEAFERYYRVFPENTILLVDTYDTIEAIKKITRLEYRDHIQAVRLDSGDLVQLSRESRQLLDQAGLNHIKIIASGGLNEYKIKELVDAQAPIDAFGVGTDMVTSSDYSAADLIYKLVQTEENGKIKYKSKRSPEKKTVPGQKQVYRITGDDGKFAQDIITLVSQPGIDKAQPLLQQVMAKGQRLGPRPATSAIRSSCLENVNRLPAHLLSLEREGSYPVTYSQEIQLISTQGR